MSQNSIEPVKYVDSCVDESRARSYLLRASASSWKPSTIRLTASSSVIPWTWMRASMIAFVIERR